MPFSSPTGDWSGGAKYSPPPWQGGPPCVLCTQWPLHWTLRLQRGEAPPSHSHFEILVWCVSSVNMWLQHALSVKLVLYDWLSGDERPFRSSSVNIFMWEDELLSDGLQAMVERLGHESDILMTQHTKLDRALTGGFTKCSGMARLGAERVVPSFTYWFCLYALSLLWISLCTPFWWEHCMVMKPNVYIAKSVLLEDVYYSSVTSSSTCKWYKCTSALLYTSFLADSGGWLPSAGSWPACWSEALWLRHLPGQSCKGMCMLQESSTL